MGWGRGGEEVLEGDVVGGVSLFHCQVDDLLKDMLQSQRRSHVAQTVRWAVMNHIFRFQDIQLSALYIFTQD